MIHAIRLAQIRQTSIVVDSFKSLAAMLDAASGSPVPSSRDILKENVTRTQTAAGIVPVESAVDKQVPSSHDILKENVTRTQTAADIVPAESAVHTQSAVDTQSAVHTGGGRLSQEAEASQGMPWGPTPQLPPARLPEEVHVMDLGTNIVFQLNASDDCVDSSIGCRKFLEDGLKKEPKILFVCTGAGKRQKCGEWLGAIVEQMPPDGEFVWMRKAGDETHTFRNLKYTGTELELVGTES